MRREERTFTLNGQLSRFWAGVPAFWRFQLSGWAAFFILTLPVRLTLSENFALLLGSFVIRDGFSFGLTLVMRAVYDWVYRRHKIPAWITGSIATASVTAGLLQLPVYYLLGDVLPFEEKTIFGHSVPLGIFYYRTGLFICWSLLYFGIRQMRDGMIRDLQMVMVESEKREAELQMLRAQMNPHFLFNALNTVRAGIGEKAKELIPVIEGLAGYLRYSLAHRKDVAVPLQEEIEALSNYLVVEKARFGEELEVDSQIDQEACPIKVPGVLLQPLVEDAIKYGRATSQIPLRVRIRISCESDFLRLEVANSGRWVERQGKQVGGIGLGNLRQRLALLYPDRHIFHTAEENEWVRVTLRIPKEIKS